MSLKRTDYKNDLYPIAGNMDWLRKFADSIKLSQNQSQGDVYEYDGKRIEVLNTNKEGVLTDRGFFTHNEFNDALNSGRARKVEDNEMSTVENVTQKINQGEQGPNNFNEEEISETPETQSTPASEQPTETEALPREQSLSAFNKFQSNFQELNNQFNSIENGQEFKILQYYSDNEDVKKILNQYNSLKKQIDFLNKNIFANSSKILKESQFRNWISNIPGLGGLATEDEKQRRNQNLKSNPNYQNQKNKAIYDFASILSNNIKNKIDSLSNEAVALLSDPSIDDKSRSSIQKSIWPALSASQQIMNQMNLPIQSSKNENIPQEPQGPSEQQLPQGAVSQTQPPVTSVPQNLPQQPQTNRPSGQSALNQQPQSGESAELDTIAAQEQIKKSIEQVLRLINSYSQLNFSNSNSINRISDLLKQAIVESENLNKNVQFENIEPSTGQETILTPPSPSATPTPSGAPKKSIPPKTKGLGSTAPKRREQRDDTMNLYPVSKNKNWIKVRGL